MEKQQDNPLDGAYARAKSRNVKKIFIGEKILVYKDNEGYYIDLDKDEYVTGIKLVPEEFLELVDALNNEKRLEIMRSHVK